MIEHRKRQRLSSIISELSQLPVLPKKTITKTKKNTFIQSSNGNLTPPFIFNDIIFDRKVLTEENDSKWKF